MVTRLDALEPAEVRRMILDGIRAEEEGLWGWGYIDLRGTTETGYIRGEQWIAEAGEQLRHHGIPVITDDLPETIQEGFPVTDAAAYYGWYAGDIDGPFAPSSFRFVPGAVAVHLHSYSAATFREPGKCWTAPLISRGAGISLGNVAEPYLPFTTNLGLFSGALLSGDNVATAYYRAQPVLSWMSVCVGDPLYRPYAKLNAGGGPAPWGGYHDLVMAHNGDVMAAAPDLRAKALELGESLYLEALGNAQMSAGKNGLAAESFRNAQPLAKDDSVRFRLLLEQARALEKNGEKTKACNLLRGALPGTKPSARQNLIRSWIRRMEQPSSQPGR
jgi:hypothetical protein